MNTTLTQSAHQVNLEVRPALTGNAHEIKSTCPVCGSKKKGWCYILPGDIEAGSLTRIICRKTPNPSAVEEAGLGEDSLTIPLKENGRFVRTKKKEGEVPCLVRVFKREVEIITELRKKGVIPAPSGKKKAAGQQTTKVAAPPTDTSTWLTEEEFDRQYWLLARNFSLDRQHVADLARRGYTEEQMKRYGFFSLYKGAIAPRGVSIYLPGFAQEYDGNRARVANSLPEDGGYAVPYFNSDGRVIGFQIRTSWTDRKYVWARGKNPSKLKRNEEDPVSILHSPDRRRILLAMEGGLKGINCFERLNLNTLSAAGGYFSRGKEQVTEAIAKFGIEQIILCPDAGDTANPHTRNRWTAQAEWFRNSFPHVQVLFLWWGQLDKNKHQDIDEVSLDTLSTSRQLTIEEWTRFLRSNISSFKDLMREMIDLAHAADEEENQERKRSFGEGFEPQEAAGETAYLWKKGDRPILGHDPDSPVRKPNPTAIFKKGDQRDLILAIAKQGGRVIANTGVPGSGKSFFMGTFDLNGTPYTKSYYISETHNNPSDDSIAERYTNIAPRHNGGIRIGPNKFKFNVTPQELEKAKPEDRIPANCSRVEEFNAFYRNGFSGESLDETPCGTCPHFTYCRVKEGDGYGYFAQKINALKPETQYVRCDIRQLPKDLNCKDAIFFVDEAEKQFQATRSTVVDYASLLTQLEKLQVEDQAIAEDLKWLRQGINQLFLHKEGDNFGLSHDEITEVFKAEGVPSRYKLRSLLSAIAGILTPQFRSLLELPDSLNETKTPEELGAAKLIEKHGLQNLDFTKYILSKYYREKIDVTLGEEALKAVKNWYDFVGRNHYKPLREAADRNRAAANYFIEEVAEKNLEILNSLPGQGIMHLLEYFYTGKGALRIEGAVKSDDRRLIITLPQLRYVEILKKAGMVVLFDATMDIDTTKEIFKVPEKSVYHIQEELPSYENLEVISVNIHGVGSSCISERAKARLDAAVAEIEAREEEGKVAVIGRKKDGDEFYLFNHNRGSNEFFKRGIKTLVIKGTPWLHVGAMLDEFRAIYGDRLEQDDFDQRFNEFYMHKVGAEIQQACGRLRHQWRPEEKLKIYILTAKLDLSFLQKRYGVSIKHLEGFELTPYAGTKSQSLIFRLLGVAKTLFDQSGGTKLPNQKDIANSLGVSQGRVSQISEVYLQRGWADLRRILLASLYDPLRGINKKDRRSSDGIILDRDNDPPALFFSEEVYSSIRREGSIKCWEPEVFDDSIHHVVLAEMLEGYEGQGLAPWTNWLEGEIHPFDQGQAIASLFANSASGMDARSNKYGVNYAEIEPFIELIWGENSWFSKPVGLELAAIA